MKTFFRLILLLSLTLTSCQKEVIVPNDEVEVVEAGILIYGDWVLEDAKMYVNNLETGENIVYNHFDASRPVSSVNYNGSSIDIETITKGVTKWSFEAPASGIGMGKFFLNGNTNNPYGFNVTKSNTTIVEYPTATATTMNLNGSAIPINAVVKSYDDQTVEFKVYEAYTSINGLNCRYYSILTFKKI